MNKMNTLTSNSFVIKYWQIAEKLFDTYRNFILYAIIGVSAAVLDFFLFYIFTNVIGLNKFIANVLGTSIAILYSFSLNTILNFKTKDMIVKRLLSFTVVGLIGMGITMLVLYIFVNILGLDKNLVKLGSLFIVVIVQYTLNKNISFREKTIT